MNRYSLDIFKNPVMHDKGDYCLYQEYKAAIKLATQGFKDEITDLKLEKSIIEKNLSEKNYQYEHALKVATEAQNELRILNLQSNVLCCLVVVLVVVEAWLISGMF